MNAPANSAVYLSSDICQLFGCGINQIDPLIKVRVIPAPLGQPVKGQKRRWAKAAIDKKLGLRGGDAA